MIGTVRNRYGVWCDSVGFAIGFSVDIKIDVCGAKGKCFSSGGRGVFVLRNFVAEYA